MAKSNQNFKKPVNNQETIINEEEEKNKKMIIIVVLAIIVVLGLIIGSITYFNGRDVEEDKKGNDDKNKPTEIVNPKPVEDDKKPVVNEPTKPVVTTPVVVKPKEDVAVTPTDPKEVTAVIESVDENDYMVTMEGNKAKISGVSRFVAAQDGDFTNAIVIKVVLDDSYSRNDLKDMIVTTTTNGVTTNNFDYVIKEGTKTSAEGINTPELYFEWVQPVGHGKEVPTSFTIKIGEEVTTYEIDLEDLKIESEVESTEKSMFVVPVTTQVAGSYTYGMEVYRKLSADEIKWDLGVETASLDEEVSQDLTTENTISNDLSDVDAVQPKETTPIETIKADAPDYSKELDYTIKFLVDGEVDGDVIDYTKFKGKLIVKIYAPVIEYIDQDGITKKQVTITEDDISIVTPSTGDVNPNKEVTKGTEIDGRVYVELSYDTKQGTPDENLENQVFTIDWTSDTNVDGTVNYEFDLSELRKAKEESQTPTTMDLNGDDIDEEQEKETLGDEQPKEVEKLDTPVQPETPSDSTVNQTQVQVDAGVEGTLAE